jgi:hypothetical protein
MPEKETAMPVALTNQKLTGIILAVLPTVFFIPLMEMLSPPLRSYVVLIDGLALTMLSFLAWDLHAKLPAHRRRTDLFNLFGFLVAAVAVAALMYLYPALLIRYLTPVQDPASPMDVDTLTAAIETMRGNLRRGMTIGYWAVLLILKALFVMFWLMPERLRWYWLTLLLAPMLLILQSRACFFMQSYCQGP